MQPMNTDDVLFPLSDPDATSSHIRDLHVSHLREGNDACTRTADSARRGPSGWRLRSHPARRRTAEYLMPQSGFTAYPADWRVREGFYNRRV